MEEKIVDKINTEGMDNIPYKIGTLTKEVIELLDLSLQETDIIMWGDRIEHIEKHKEDFDDVEKYKSHMELIPQIISAPDYVSIHPKGNTIEYIKKIDDIMLVAIRIRTVGKLAFRTAYPIKQSKLDNYIKNGRAVKMVDSTTDNK